VNDTIDARRAAPRACYPEWEPVTLSGFLDRSAEKYGDRYEAARKAATSGTMTHTAPPRRPSPAADPKY
jgi:hypothetical protein